MEISPMRYRWIARAIIVVAVLALIVIVAVYLNGQGKKIVNFAATQVPDGFPVELNIEPKAEVLQNYTVYNSKSTEAVRQFHSINSLIGLSYVFRIYLPMHGWQVTEDNVANSSVETKLEAVKNQQKITVDISNAGIAKGSMVTIDVTTNK